MAAPTLIATVGGSTANSYVTVADCTTYLNARLNVSAWTDAVTAATGDPERALIAATKRLDEERWVGDPVNALTGTTDDTTQALQWPRYGAIDQNGWEYLSTVIPQPVKDATCELALYLLNQGTTDPSQPTGLEGFKNVTVGALDITPVSGYAPDELPAVVVRKLAGLRTSSPNTLRLVRA
jgi:hypothetical protein